MYDNQKRQGKTRLDFPSNSKAVKKQCEYCGKFFWTNRPSQARFCNGTSTCRVYFYNRKKLKSRAQHLIIKFMIEEIKRDTKKYREQRKDKMKKEMNINQNS